MMGVTLIFSKYNNMIFICYQIIREGEKNLHYFVSIENILYLRKDLIINFKTFNYEKFRFD